MLLPTSTDSPVGIFNWSPSVFATKTSLVSVSGCPAGLLARVVERSTVFGQVFQSPVSVLFSPNLMHRPRGSMFGLFDFFSQLNLLVIFLDGCQNLIWIVQTPELSQVGIPFLHRASFPIVWISLSVFGKQSELETSTWLNSSDRFRSSCEMKAHTGLHGQNCPNSTNARCPK